MLRARRESFFLGWVMDWGGGYSQNVGIAREAWSRRRIQPDGDYYERERELRERVISRQSRGIMSAPVGIVARYERAKHGIVARYERAQRRKP
jgi:hypothetical protein